VNFEVDLVRNRPKEQIKITEIIIITKSNSSESCVKTMSAYKSLVVEIFSYNPNTQKLDDIQQSTSNASTVTLNQEPGSRIFCPNSYFTY